MAYYTNLIALRIIKGKYVVQSCITANLNVLLLEEDHILNDASENNFYLDQAAIIQKEKFIKYLDTSPSNSSNSSS